MKGEDRLKKDFSALRQLRYGLCTCTIQRVNRQDNIIKSAFERGMVVSGKRTGSFQVLQRCWVFHTTVSCVYQKY